MWPVQLPHSRVVVRYSLKLNSIEDNTLEGLSIESSLSLLKDNANAWGLDFPPATA